MNRFFGELPTAMAPSPRVESLHQARVALIFATGETRVAKLELCPIPESRNVAVSARLEQLGDDPRDGLLQYLTQEGVNSIHPTERSMEGTTLCLSLATA